MKFHEISRRLRAHSRYTRKRYTADGSKGRDYGILRTAKGWEVEVWTNNRFTEGYVFRRLEDAKQGVTDLEKGCFDKSKALEEIIIH